MKARGILCAGALALSAALALAPFAQAEEATPAAAWKVVAATGPTNLAPQQSEVQKLVIGAEGGTFTLGRKTAGTGKGTPVTVNGGLSVASGSPTATILAGAFEVGARITTTTANTIPAETTILACTPDCNPGSTLTLSKPAEATNTHLGVKTYTAKISGLTQSGLHVGDVISGTGLAAGTTITELGAGTLTASRPTTAAYSSGQLSFTAEERTPQLPYNSSAAALEAALEALPAFPAGTFAVSGGPGGDAGTPYLIAFGGPEFEDQDVEALSADGSALAGEPALRERLHHPARRPRHRPDRRLRRERRRRPGRHRRHHAHRPLPAGVAIAAAPDGGGAWSCPTWSAAEATCTETGTVAALGKAETIGIPIEVTATAPFQASAEVKIEGGGAGQDSYTLPIVVSSEDAAPGAAAFWAGAFNADGSPRHPGGLSPLQRPDLLRRQQRPRPAGLPRPRRPGQGHLRRHPAGLSRQPDGHRALPAEPDLLRRGSGDRRPHRLHRLRQGRRRLLHHHRLLKRRPRLRLGRPVHDQNRLAAAEPARLPAKRRRLRGADLRPPRRLDPRQALQILRRARRRPRRRPRQGLPHPAVRLRRRGARTALGRLPLRHLVRPRQLPPRLLPPAAGHRLREALLPPRLQPGAHHHPGLLARRRRRPPAPAPGRAHRPRSAGRTAAEARRREAARGP